jgi:hypothetical protein
LPNLVDQGILLQKHGAAQTEARLSGLRARGIATKRPPLDPSIPRDF